MSTPARDGHHPASASGFLPTKLLASATGGDFFFAFMTFAPYGVGHLGLMSPSNHDVCSFDRSWDVCGTPRSSDPDCAACLFAPGGKTFERTAGAAEAAVPMF
jgi:hypothetical protein